ncbi:RteC domain-containing protein [Paraflavitalea sp. CAU 1676]|uniref:RteC domain-containing protein n=1 Tax=Paraflavitalea sp. CAU 1676 TaxID=3032598 RepID=UPI0023DB497D|nr:RteC domain-containing protein [Paraflavitalea sp. CAU 1676]MDF2191392.1 RteC domain-containing protein [Paraflavitalea sp. CAU 1676]
MEYRSEWQSLYEALVEELAVLSRSKKPHLEMVSQAAEVCFLKMEALKATIREYPFVDSCEEIYFFREVKPQFHSSLIYYDKVHLFESERPQGKTSTVEQYISSHEEDIYRFYRQHIEFYRYFRAGFSHLDERYFTRKGSNYPFFGYRQIDTDRGFTTDKDYIVSRILANDRLSQYYEAVRTNQKSPELLAKPGDDLNSLMRWTHTKAAFVEWVYGIKSVGAINNGRTSLQQLFMHLESFFGIEVGNFSRIMQDILARKKSFTAFHEECIESLNEFRDRIEEK